MLRRVLPVLGVLALVAAACGAPDIVVRPQEPEGPAWYSLVVDAAADSGAGLSLATDAEGNPHLTYLAFEEQVAGEPPAADPLAPTLPAVMHAHLVGEVWTRGPVADDQDLDEALETAIAVDADGVHHVAWTAGGSVLYSSNPGGEFAEEPETVVDAEAVGLSITVDGDGVPMIAFQTSEDVAEGPASLVRLATSDGEGGWTVETVAEASAPEDPAGTAVLLTSDGPLVAFGSDGETMVASQRGSRWVSETVDPDGGVGVAGAIDADGNPHLAYLTSAGDVKHAHDVGEGWEISDVGTGATGSPASIAVDAEGIHHVAWQTDEGLAYVSNADGDFAEEELPASTAEGVRPGVGAGAEGTVYLAFRDEGDTEVQMAVRSEDAPLLAVPSPEETGGGGGAPPTGPPPCEPEGTELSITAQNLAFDTDCLAAPAGEPFTIEFNNQDAGVPHNVAIYTDESAAEVIFQEPPFPGPETVAYEPEPIEDEGNFFFRCDVHPTTMTGTFVVAGGR